MILRIVRGIVAADRLSALTEHVQSRYPQLAASIAGLARYHVAVRPSAEGFELVLVTFWRSAEAALEAFGGDLATPRVIDGLSIDADLREVQYFEVDESEFRQSATPAAVLRLTLGRVAPGVDVEIQQELRTRLHDLEPAMSEAYVARRIVGQEVEVAFVSAWATDHATRSLDEPLWPDIVARYDAFEVGTYRHLVSGPFELVAS